MDDRLAQVQEFPLIHIAVIAGEEPGHGAHHGILDEAGLHQVDLGLRIPAHIHIAIAAGASFDGVQRVHDVGILAVIVEAGLSHGRPDDLAHVIHDRLLFVLRGIKHLVPDELAVVQDVPAIPPAPVIDLDHRGLVLCLHAVIVEELAAHETVAFQLALDLGILLLQHILVHQLCVEQVPALLDIRHTGLPVQVQQIDPRDADIAQAVQLILVPYHLEAAGAGLALLPHGIGVHGLEIILLQDAGDDRAEHRGLLGVRLLPGPDVGFRVGLHGVRMFRYDNIVHPGASAGEASICADVGLRLLLHGVPQLPPILTGDDAPMGPAQAALVLL